ncbi:unnamed protein product, partial [marine sediment metagenome]
ILVSPVFFGLDCIKGERIDGRLLSFLITIAVIRKRSVQRGA